MKKAYSPSELHVNEKRAACVGSSEISSRVENLLVMMGQSFHSIRPEGEGFSAPHQRPNRNIRDRTFVNGLPELVGTETQVMIKGVLSHLSLLGAVRDFVSHPFS